MLTKGIIINKIIDSNKYLIRIPFLETSGFGEKQYEAILSHEPFSYNSYLPGDVVIVGFEDHDGSKPIILGKLDTDEVAQRGFISANALSVETSTTLSKDTKIGDYTYADFEKFVQKIYDMDNNIQSILETLGLR